MFLSHIAVGLAGKAVTPRTSLGTLVLAGVWLDLLWPSLLMLGWERVRVDPGNTPITPLAFELYPWSHSLVMSLGWALAVAGVYLIVRGYRRGAAVVAGSVFSHWVLDFVSHRPDLPLVPQPGTPLVGLGVWYSVPATLAVEVLGLGFGLWMYVRRTEASDAVGRHALTAFVAFLVVIYALSVFGPPPPSAGAVAWGAQAQWLLVAFAGWIDRHRVPARQWS